MLWKCSAHLAPYSGSVEIALPSSFLTRLVSLLLFPEIVLVISHNLFMFFTIQYNTIQYNTIQYNTIQYNTIQYNTIQYNTIQYNFNVHTWDEVSLNVRARGSCIKLQLLTLTRITQLLTLLPKTSSRDSYHISLSPCQ